MPVSENILLRVDRLKNEEYPMNIFFQIQGVILHA